MISAREKAKRYADREGNKRGTREWYRAYNGYLAGWTANNRRTTATIRLKVQRILGKR